MNLCMSWLNIKNKDRQCTRPKDGTTDFCRYHKRSSIYMQKKQLIDYAKLDETCPETLLSMHDSWKDIPQMYWLKMGRRWWDVRILAKIIANQLCTSEMSLPKPTYPHDPFDRINFSPDDLVLFKQKCIECNISLYTGLCELLNSDIKLLFCQESGTNYQMSSGIINILSVNLRFKLLNNTNSQNLYIGLWVPKKELKSKFEIAYKHYDNIPMQIIVNDLYYGPILMNNPHKESFKKSLSCLPLENPDIDLYLSHF